MRALTQARAIQGGARLEMFTPEQLEKLEVAKIETLEKSLDVLVRATTHQYQTVKGREFATHGFGRRLQMLDHCLKGVLETLPPKDGDLPSRSSVMDATAFLHSFLVNCYGAFDNLAHIWVAETNLCDSRGRPLTPNQIGLTAKYTVVLESLPSKVRAKLGEYDEWFAYLENYRHALAHRIPVYIPDRAYRPKDRGALESIRAKKEGAYQSCDYLLLDKLQDEEERIGVFNPLMMHSYGEKAHPMYFHSQMLCDHATVVEFATLFFDNLGDSNSDG